jgi:hypothetical protein
MTAQGATPAAPGCIGHHGSSAPWESVEGLIVVAAAR